MAYALLSTPTALSQAGVVNPTFQVAVVGGHMFANDGRVFLEIRNDDAAAKTITIPTGEVLQGDLAVGDRTMVIPAGQVGYIGPFPQKPYNQVSGADAGNVYIDYSAVTAVTIKAFRV